VASVRGVLDALCAVATRHRFLDAVREDTISDLAFDRWLGQDGRFVADLLTFQARLLTRAPRPAQAGLAGGCVALVAARSVLERVYLLAWGSAASSTSPFTEFVHHWTAPGFAGYVAALGASAVPDGQGEMVGDVLSPEVAFWDMALA
jgi:thiaminase